MNQQELVSTRAFWASQIVLTEEKETILSLIRTEVKKQQTKPNLAVISRFFRSMRFDFGLKKSVK